MGLVTTLVAALAGCGSSGNGVASKSASEILAASVEAAKNASAVRVVSKTTVAGQTITVKLELSKEAARSTVSLPGRRIETLRSGSTLYVRGDKTYETYIGETVGGRAGVAAALKLPSGTWLKVPAGNKSVPGLGSITVMSSELPLILGRSPVTKGSETTVNGQKAIALKQHGKLFTGLIYIATTGQPYPIQIVKHGRESGTTTFTGWNDPSTVTPPTNTVDISQLEHAKAH